jgi:hypothetical protein
MKVAGKLYFLLKKIQFLLLSQHYFTLAFGDQGAFLKNRPLDPQKTFYSPSGALFAVILGVMRH